MADAEHWSARLEDAAVAAGVPGAVLGVWSAGEATVVPYGVLSTRTEVPTTADSVFQTPGRRQALRHVGTAPGRRPRRVDHDAGR